MKLFNSIVGFLLKDITAYTRRERIILSAYFVVPIPLVLIMSLFIAKDGQIYIVGLILAHIVFIIPVVYSFLPAHLYYIVSVGKCQREKPEIHKGFKRFGEVYDFTG